MKNLKTAEIHEFVEMTESELKNTFGGSGGDSGPSGAENDECSYTCPNGKTETIICYGDCKELDGGEVGVQCVVNGKPNGSVIKCLG